jgi:hypothetical protein
MARSCAAIPPSFSAIQCLTAPGTGKQHSWQVIVQVCHREVNGETVTLSACRNQTSPVFPAMTAYAPPAVAAISGEGRSSHTAGGDTVILTGANFGFSDAKLQLVQYRGVKVSAVGSNSTDPDAK